MKTKLAIAAILASSSAAAQQDFTLDLQNLDCEIPLDGPVSFETNPTTGETIFVTTTAGTQIPVACPGAGGAVSISTNATGEIQPDDEVQIDWTVPTTGTCELTRNGINTQVTVTAPSGNTTQTPGATSTYEVSCTETIGNDVSGAFARTLVEVDGSVGGGSQCQNSQPHNAIRAPALRYQLGSLSPSQPVEQATTFEEAFGPWPGNSVNATFFPRMGRNEYVALPFIPTANGERFVISYELSTGAVAADSMQVTVSECFGGFRAQDALCSFLLSPSSDAVIREGQCGLQEGTQYFLNFVFADSDDGNGNNTCSASECRWVMDVTGI